MYTGHWKSPLTLERSIQAMPKLKAAFLESCCQPTILVESCATLKLVHRFRFNPKVRQVGWNCMNAQEAAVKDLETRYPQLLFNKSDSKVTTQSRVTESGSESSKVLDLATVVKATQVISSEMMLDKLLTKLMKILIENAGAQKGFLILEQTGKLLIEAEGAAKEDSVTVLQSIPIEPVGVYGSNPLLSSAIINYVARTKESVVLNDATREGQFTKDSYITQNQPKSILCVPLINQDKVISIVYLENNLTTGAFTPDRLEVIKLLSAQAAIAIANAKLYSEVKESERKLARFNESFSRFVPRQFLQSLEKFEEVLRLNPEDRVTQIYLERCQKINPIDINNYKLDKFAPFTNTNSALLSL